MSVDLNPDELGFRRPFNREVTQVLNIRNANSSPVAFKVKTTAPKQYCVRPNSGIIKPNGAVDVQVLLQAMKEDPPLDARCRDKFLVQSVQVNSEDESNVSNLWSSIEKTSKSSIQEKKIRVQFLPATGANEPNGVSHEDEPSILATSAYGSPTAATDGHRSSTTETTRAGGVSAGEAGGIAGAASAVATAIPTNQEELKQQLSAAQAKIKELQTQITDPQVRQRKVAEAQEKVQTVVQQSQETGVPLHIVAALCLVSFLIAWLFF